MPASEPLHARLIGALFVERGLVSESQIRVALEIQRETGQQLGQVLVERFGVSRKELASVVAEQWAKLGGSSGPEDTASWRRLGEIFVERGFVSEDELEQALTRQRQTGERLGEALVAQGVISKFELAGALAEQMAMLEDTTGSEAPADQPEATVHHLPTRIPDIGEIPFGTVAEIAPELSVVGDEAAEEPNLPTDEVDDLVGDVGEIAGEPEDAVEDVGEIALELEGVAEDVGEIALEPEGVAEDVREIALEPDGVPEDVGEIAGEPEGLAEDAGEIALEAEDVGEFPVEAEAADAAEEILEAADGADAMPEPVEAIAIDDVGHVSLVGPAVEPVEPEPLEAEQPAALFDDLRDALLADVSSADEGQVEQQHSVVCLAFAPTTDGYRFVALERVPEPGQTIDVPDVGDRLVLRVGRSPIPGDRRPCAYVEEPVVAAPVAALVH